MLATENSDPTEFISIEVTNIGYGPTYVEGLFWKIGLFRRRKFFLVPTNSPYSGTIPCVLKEGERTNFLFDPDNFKKNAIPSVRDALGKFPNLALKRTLVLVNTSVGKLFQCHPEKELRSWLESEIGSRPQ